jgi:hypothetical protein
MRTGFLDKEKMNTGMTSQADLFAELAPHFNSCLPTEKNGEINTSTTGSNAPEPYRRMLCWFDGDNDQSAMTAMSFILN